jgi:hypothetical protein
MPLTLPPVGIRGHLAGPVPFSKWHGEVDLTFGKVTDTFEVRRPLDRWHLGEVLPKQVTG